MEGIAVFWFRRDLRLEDNHGLVRALQSGLPVLPVFIFDPGILTLLQDRHDRRVNFIHQWLTHLQEALQAAGSSLRVEHGAPLEVFERLCTQHKIAAVYCNEDYEPYALQRDDAVASFLASREIAFHGFKDQVIMGPDEVLKSDGTPYTVFTPYSKRWRALVGPAELASFQLPDDPNWLQLAPLPMPSLGDLGFVDCGETYPLPDPKSLSVDDYEDTRDRPDLETTTRLGPHLRFGTVSVRRLARWGGRHSQTWLTQLIWRDFFTAILCKFPTVVNAPFREKYSMIPWRNDKADFQAWCEGRTGYPMVDAGMRQLLETGYMHNRVRMVVASFLCKHLLIDWRWGEAWFARHLLDFDLAANNGNWQWAAGTGCDAAPYFRVFNPLRQQERFDPSGAYVRRWVPEVYLPTYAPPIVDHKTARERAVGTYKEGLLLYETST